MSFSPFLLQNEEILKKATSDYQEKLKRSEEKYRLLKKHAEEKIERFVFIIFAEKKHKFKLESLTKRTMTVKYVDILEKELIDLRIESFHLTSRRPYQCVSLL